MKTHTHTSFRRLFLLTMLCAFSGCTELNSPYGSNSRYEDPYYRRPSYDYDRDSYYDRKRDIKNERRDLERERDRVEAERARLERERARSEAAAVHRPPVRQPERCPSGFSPSENKCSPEERRRGCKDMRLPGGLGCVRR